MYMREWTRCHRPTMSSPLQLTASDEDIKSVTIYKSDRAEVARSFQVTLQSGRNEVEILGLSSAIDVDSARVTGLGDARLFEVSCKIQKPESWDVSPDSASERIRALRAKNATLSQEKRNAESAARLLREYGKSLGGQTQAVPPADADAFLDRYLARGADLARTCARLDEEMLQIQREIQKISAEGSAVKGKTDGRVTAVIMAKAQTEVVLKLTYVVRQARWKPSYELHAHSDESGMPASSVSLHYRAIIMQMTGETWRGVALTLSTARPSLADESIPELTPSRLVPPPTPPRVGPEYPGFAGWPDRPAPIAPPVLGGPPGPGAQPTVIIQPPYQSRARSSRSRSRSRSHSPPIPVPFIASEASSSEASWAASDVEDEVELVVPPSSFKPTTSIAKESPLFISYKIDGESSIPSDGEDHKVSIAEPSFQATVSHVVVPKVKAVVYLEAKVKNTSDYRLMPGPVNIFFDDSFVSKTSIKDIAPGGEFTCTLGPDLGTRVTYNRTSKLETDAQTSRFSEQYATTTCSASTSVTNTHPFALAALIVRDSLPISDDEKRVRVILRDPAVLAEAEQGEEKDVGQYKASWSDDDGRKKGLYEWHCSVEAGKDVTLLTAWDVKAPADVKWIEKS
ncbi:hypothetical protein PENSPDRAFT_603927 [Peniophora sp. CONT]|nr:hypothetical protein PENSPDRAFT_603927 [Peniophora sp. CONT]